jgi:hypothetical protein
MHVPIYSTATSSLIAICSGVVATKVEPWVCTLADGIMLYMFPFLTLAWRQSLLSLIVMILCGAPIAWFGKSKAAAYGALAGIVVIASFFVSWVLISEPRPSLNYTFRNAIGDIIYIAAFALTSQVWWVLTMKKIRHAETN